MKKIPCLFVHEVSGGQRNKACTDQVTPGCEWVMAGEGIATQKFDGTACLVRDGLLYARYDAKRGKTPPPGAIPCDPAPDPISGHWPHWVLVEDQPQYKFHKEAFALWRSDLQYLDGTYELVGPAINSNKERRTKHELVRHGSTVITGVDRTYLDLRGFLAQEPIEGIVFHHPDGRMAKIRRSDFMFPWPASEAK